MNMFGESFSIEYRCYSVSMFPNSDKQVVENGGKIIMPPSALERLTRLNVEYPMLFKLTNNTSHAHTHCGVLEFVADEGKIYIPYWMMRNLGLDEGLLVQVESVSVPVATFSKFQPLNYEFLDISNPKAVLENALRNFACLTKNDVVAINYNDRIYDLKVLEVKPGDAVSIIECDMNVEFSTPPGYQEGRPSRAQKENKATDIPNTDDADRKELMSAAAAQAAEKEGFLAFHGAGSRMDGKKKNIETPLEELIPNKEIPRGIPDYDYEPGYIKFWRPSEDVSSAKKEDKEEVEEEEKEKYDPFKGQGSSLRNSKP